MKNRIKTALCVPVLLGMMAASVLFAQEVKEDAKGQKDGLHWSLGLSSEGNMNVPKGYALGSGLYGLIDTALLFRWNFYDFSKPKKPDSGFFVQAEGGVSLGWNGKSSNPMVISLPPLIYKA